MHLKHSGRIECTCLHVYKSSYVFNNTDGFSVSKICPVRRLDTRVTCPISGSQSALSSLPGWI